jgi:hypothetical protein
MPATKIETTETIRSAICLHPHSLFSTMVDRIQSLFLHIFLLFSDMVS